MKPTGKLKFAYESIKNLEIKMEGLETQNIELMARCEELATALIGVMIIIENNCKAQKLKTGFINAIEVLNQTPQQSLNEIKAQAIEGAVYKCFPDSQIYTSQMAGIMATVKSELSEYVANIRNHNEKTTA